MENMWVVIGYGCSKFTPFVYDTVDDKGKNDLIKKFNANLVYDSEVGCKYCDEKYENNDENNNKSDNNDDTCTCMYETQFDILVQCETYCVSNEIFEKYFTRYKKEDYCRGSIVFVKKEDYTIGEIMRNMILF